MLVQEQLLRELVAEHRRLAGRRSLVRAARSCPTYDVTAGTPGPSRADVWDIALSAFTRAAAAT